MKKKTAFLLVAAVLLLAGCAVPQPTPTIPPSPSPSLTPDDPSPAVTPESTPALQVYSLYIGQDGAFTAYPSSIPWVEDPSADPGGLAAALIGEIAALTGWNLDLAEEVYSGKAGMSICFAQTAALFTGLPEPQKDQFQVQNAADLTFTILDSITETLRMAFAPNAPQNLNIWFCGPDGGALDLTTLGVTLPLEEPYSHETLEKLLASDSIS